MNILDLIYGNTLEGYQIYYVRDILKNTNFQAGNLLLANINDNKVYFKCVCNYYLDPNTNKKIKKINLANPCPKIHNILNINNCSSLDCKTCHLKAIENFSNKEIKLLKKK